MPPVATHRPARPGLPAANDRLPRTAGGWQTLVMLIAGITAAVSCDRTVTRKNLKLSSVHLNLGRDYLDKKMPDRAKAELLKSLHHNPNNRQANHLLGVVFFLEGVHALNYIDRTQCLRGKSASEQREIADERIRRAEKHLRLAVSQAESAGQTNSDGLNYLANVAVHFQRHDEAIKLCTAALDNVLYAGQHLALCNRGWARFLKGDAAGAARDLRESLFHQPEFCLARFRLGKVYFSQKDYQRATTELEKAVSRKDCPIQETHQLLGMIYLRLGQSSKAHESFARCVELGPLSCVSEECRRYVKLIDSPGPR